MSSPADERRWFARDRESDTDFCLAFVRGLSAGEVLDRLGAMETVETLEPSNFEPVGKPVPQKLNASEIIRHYSNSLTGLAFVAVAEIGTWTVLVEPDGILCTQEAVIRTLSEHGDVVALYHNTSDAASSFLWFGRGIARLQFDPQCMHDGVPEWMTSVVGEFTFQAHTDSGRFDEVAMVLIRRITGIPVTSNVLDNAVYRCGIVVDPPLWSDRSRQQMNDLRRPRSS